MMSINLPQKRNNGCLFPLYKKTVYGIFEDIIAIKMLSTIANGKTHNINIPLLEGVILVKVIRSLLGNFINKQILSDS